MEGNKILGPQAQLEGYDRNYEEKGGNSENLWWCFWRRKVVQKRRMVVIEGDDRRRGMDWEKAVAAGSDDSRKAAERR